MGLKNYTPERHEIPLKNNPFLVRGLSLEDISVLINRHLPDIEALFDLFTSGHDLSKLDDNAFKNLAASIVGQAPGFAANLIALAADEPDSAKQAAMLPAPVQINAVIKIGDLTFSEVGGIKKGMESIAALLSQANLKSLKGPTKAG